MGLIMGDGIGAPYQGGDKETLSGGNGRILSGGMKNIPPLAPLRKGGADVVSRGVDSIRLIYTKTNK